MALKVTLNMPAFPKGKIIIVPGIGQLRNGEPTTLTKQQEERFKRKKGVSLEEALKDNPRYTIQKSGKKSTPAQDVEPKGETAAVTEEVSSSNEEGQGGE